MRHGTSDFFQEEAFGELFTGHGCFLGYEFRIVLFLVIANPASSDGILGPFTLGFVIFCESMGFRMPADMMAESEFKGIRTELGIFRQAFPYPVDQLPSLADVAMAGFGRCLHGGALLGVNLTGFKFFNKNHAIQRSVMKSVG